MPLNHFHLITINDIVPHKNDTFQKLSIYLINNFKYLILNLHYN